MAGLVVAHPTRVLMAGLAPLAMLAAFYPSMETSYDERGNQPDDTESNRGFALLADHFPVNEATPSFVVISTEREDLRAEQHHAAHLGGAEIGPDARGVAADEVALEGEDVPLRDARLGERQADALGDQTARLLELPHVGRARGHLHRRGGPGPPGGCDPARGAELRRLQRARFLHRRRHPQSAQGQGLASAYHVAD